MDWNLQEAMDYYKKQGAPGDQSAVLNLLREVQRECGGSIPRSALAEIGAGYGVKEGLFLALIKRIPGLRLGDGHTLEICGGPNCGKRADLLRIAERLCKGKNVAIKTVPCMRQCGKGPNIKWDGVLYHGADEAQLKHLIENS